ncbi:MAG: phage tail protein [Desulfobacterales bacterium]|nr:phage tail protein [Desulfobacterales bacterium]
MSDANGLRFWMLANEEDWCFSGDSHDVRYDPRRLSLTLASGRPDAPPPTGEEVYFWRRDAIEGLMLVPGARDGLGARVRWDYSLGAVMTAGSGDETTVHDFGGPAPEDLAMGRDGVLYMTFEGRVTMVDLTGDWEPVELGKEGFDAWRLAADPGGGVWVLDRTTPRLGKVRGRPLPERAHVTPYRPDTFRPQRENPDPPAFILLPEGDFSPAERPVAIASNPAGVLALLTRIEGEDATLRLYKGGAWSPPARLAGSRFTYSMAWVSESRIALLVINLTTEALVYPLITTLITTSITTSIPPADAPEDVPPVGDVYPLKNHFHGPFINGCNFPAYYPANGAPGASSPLHHLSLPSFAPEGFTASRRPMDGLSAGAVWHRLYLEASIPPNCGVKVCLAAYDPPEEEGPTHWWEHRFGVTPGCEEKSDAPRGAWSPLPSEIPHHPGLTPCKREKDRTGLFTVLIQRAGRRVRTLRGRYLEARVYLYGDGQRTPEVWALRAYASRFSYVNNYLPALYRETLMEDDPAPGARKGVHRQSTPADFLERFLCNFEGILTPLEDRIASAYLLTDPRTAPREALEWLGSWIGLGFDPACREDQRRALLENAPRLFRMRGTYEGLNLALNLATRGGVDAGRVLILEEWRLRRVFATILGADLAEEEDPLLAGLVVSGNSYVGDALFLGDEHKKEFLALFSGWPADRGGEESEEAAVRALYENLANRVTILVRQGESPEELGLIRRVVELETPAHVITRVVAASHPFMVGLASLVGVDTFLVKETPPGPVTIGRTHLGMGDRVRAVK